MKDELVALLAGKDGYNLKLNTMREYLQLFILRILYKNNFFKHSAFLGGTCLRVVHAIKRFSEDLDFSLLEAQGFDFDKIIRVLSRELEDSGYHIAVKIKKNSVFSAFFKFSDLLYECGVSNRKNENISIKIELDTRPPAGSVTEKHIINKYFMFGLVCYDLATLSAGKINALLTRDYTKGRDYYDIFWYLTTHKNLEPNYEFLKNALTQFNRQGILEAHGNWKSSVLEKLQDIDWTKIRKEMELLIEDRDELDLFTKDNLIMLLSR